jgi:hypothetical protein
MFALYSWGDHFRFHIKWWFVVVWLILLKVNHYSLEGSMSFQKLRSIINPFVPG